MWRIKRKKLYDRQVRTRRPWARARSRARGQGGVEEEGGGERGDIGIEGSGFAVIPRATYLYARRVRRSYIYVHS